MPALPKAQSFKVNRMSDVLLSPFKLHDLTLKNRVVLAPLTRARAGAERIPNVLMSEYYRQRAGAGLLITESTSISPQALGWKDNPGIYTNAMTAGWKLIVDAVHAEGTPIFLQLWHCGRHSHSDFLGGVLPVAPSPIAITGHEARTPLGKKPYETPHELNISEIAAIVADYRAAATRTKQAGFDGVEIHAANGYLIDQFLQSVSNHRTDQYGGSIENRYRLLDEIVTAIAEVFPANRVAVRIAPNAFFGDMGVPEFREQFAYVAQQLDKFGLAYLHVIDGIVFGYHEHGPPMTLREMRQHFRGPLMGNCGYTRELAEQRIADGDADLIAFGRPFIANPDLPTRFANRWPLAEPDEATFYVPGPKGYTDYPPYQL